MISKGKEGGEGGREGLTLVQLDLILSLLLLDQLDNVRSSYLGLSSSRMPRLNGSVRIRTIPRCKQPPSEQGLARGVVDDLHAPGDGNEGGDGVEGGGKGGQEVVRLTFLACADELERTKEEKDIK